MQKIKVDLQRGEQLAFADRVKPEGEPSNMPMSQNELEDLKYAKELLENPGLAARITDALGTAIDKGFELLPAKWSDVVQQTTKESLRKALEFAVMTMDNRPRVSSWSFLHKMFAATSGAGYRAERR